MGNEYYIYDIRYFFLFFCYYLEDIDINSFVENMLFVLYSMLIVIKLLLSLEL